MTYSTVEEKNREKTSFVAKEHPHKKGSIYHCFALKNHVDTTEPLMAIDKKEG